jgi:hypothetical protein
MNYIGQIKWMYETLGLSNRTLLEITTYSKEKIYKNLSINSKNTQTTTRETCLVLLGAKYGTPELMEWFRSINWLNDRLPLFDFAIRGANVKVLEWLEDNNYEIVSEETSTKDSIGIINYSKQFNKVSQNCRSCGQNRRRTFC